MKFHRNIKDGESLKFGEVSRSESARDQLRY